LNENDKEIINVLKSIEKRLEDIKYNLDDIKREIPKVPFYGDLLQDIVKTVEDLKNR
jgi:hypothetical protein